MADIRKRIVAVYLAATVPALPAHFLLPAPWSALALLWLSVMAITALAVGVRLHRPRDIRPWALLGTGVGLFLTGQLAWHLQHVLGALPPTVPSFSDVFYVAAYPALAMAAVLFIRAHHPRYRLTAAIDALIVGTAGVLILWLTVIEHFIHDPTLGVAERAVLIAYPVGDAMLLAAAVYLLLSGRQAKNAYYLLVGALAALLVADLTYAVSTANAATTAGAALLSLISFVLFGLTALVPTMRNLTEPSDEPTAPERGRRLILLGAAIFVLPVFALAQYQWFGHVDMPLVVGATIVIVVAVLARMHELVAVHERTELRYASLLANASDAFAIVRSNGRLAYTSPASEHVLGHRAAAIEGRSVLRLVHPRERATLEQALDQVATAPRAQAEVEVQVRRGDGAWRWLAITATNRTDEPMVDGIVLNYRDVTEGRESQRRIELQARLLDEVQHAVAVADARGRVTYWNRAAEQMFGWRAAEVVGTPLLALNITGNETESLAEIRDALRHGGRWAGEFELRRRDGSRLTALVGNSALLAPGGHMKGFIAVAADISERKQLEQRLQRQAFSDALTGLANRPLFIDRIGHLLLRQPHAKKPQFAVLFLDIDDFKQVNDTMGHSAGDELLVAVAQRIVGALRPGDTAARLGGDEFAVLLEDAGQAEAERVARRLLAEFTTPVRIAGREYVASTSVGIVVPTPDSVSNAEDLLRNADLAMYGAKTTTRGSYAVYEPGMHAAAIRRLQMKTDLQHALEGGRLNLEYQPIFRLSDGAAMGAEALLRWPHDERGQVPASETIALAESAGLIHQLGQWVLDEACRQARRWRDAIGVSTRNPLPFVSINASVREILDGGYPDRVAASLRRSGLPAYALSIEISEPALMQDTEAAISALVRLKALGVRLAIDEFGTGYSSLSYLARFPLDLVKIDRSFVSAASGKQDWAVARSILDLARSLKLEVVAEGIEQIEEASKMTSLGADYGQGFHLARPTTGDAVQKVLAAGAVLRGAAAPRRGRNRQPAAEAGDVPGAS
jgi:diguanylate cyclase (GGDEF)-like protein/PAS domain S-box-containing protein